MSRTWLGLVWAIALQTVVGAQQVPRFRTSAEAVVVDVQVLDGRRPLPGLTADSFELRDNGVVQRITSLATEQAPVSLVIALDVSGSVKGAKLSHLKQAARAAIAALRTEDEACILAFSDRLSLEAQWTSDASALASAVDRLQPGGATALNDAVFAALSTRPRKDSRALILVFSDGLDSSSFLDPHTVLETARATDAVVYGVSAAPLLVANGERESLIMLRQRASLDRWFDSDPALFPQMMLPRLATETGGEFIEIADTSRLAAAFSEVVTGFRTRYVVTYSPTGVSDSGWHGIDVRLKGKTGIVRARRGYQR